MHLLKFTFVAMISLSFVSSSILAAPFSKGFFEYQQPDGTKFMIEKLVDEYGSYEITVNGHCVIINESDGYYYYGKLDSEGNLYHSSLKVKTDDINKNTSLIQLRNENQENWNEYLHLKNKDLLGAEKIAGTKSVSSYPSLPDSLYVVLVEFNDVKGDTSFTRSDVEDLFFEHDRSGYGSVRDYFHDMSDGDFDLDGSVANTGSGENINWVEMPENKDYYNDENEQNFNSNAEVVETFLDSLKSQQGIELNLGDNIKAAILYAGNVIYEARLNNRAFPDSGYYIAASEKNSSLATIGVSCHELAHVFGGINVGDYYLARHGDRLFNYWGLMGKGAENSGGACPAPLCPPLRKFLFASSFAYTNVTSSLESESIDYNIDYGLNEVYKINRRNADGDAVNGEYFLIENRQVGAGHGWNSKIWHQKDGFPPYDYLNTSEDGLLIWYYNGNVTGKPIIELVTADGSNSPYDTNEDAFRSGLNTKVTDYTSPSLLYNQSSSTNVLIFDISSTGDPMTADLWPYWGGELYDSVTWSFDQQYIGDDLTIPQGLGLTIDAWNNKVDENKKITVNGTLTLKDGSILRKTTSGSYWSGVDIKSTGVLNVDGHARIHNAYTGIDLENTNGIVNGSNVITIQNCPQCGIWVGDCSDLPPLTGQVSM